MIKGHERSLSQKVQVPRRPISREAAVTTRGLVSGRQSASPILPRYTAYTHYSRTSATVCPHKHSPWGRSFESQSKYDVRRKLIKRMRHCSEESRYLRRFGALALLRCFLIALTRRTRKQSHGKRQALLVAVFHRLYRSYLQDTFSLAASSSLPNLSLRRLLRDGV